MNTDTGLDPVLVDVVLAFAPGFKKSTLVVEEVPVSVCAEPRASKRDGVAGFKIDPYRRSPAEAQLAQYEKGIEEGWKACAEFARKQWEQRLEEIRRELGHANASHELLFRMAAENTPL